MCYEAVVESQNVVRGSGMEVHCLVPHSDKQRTLIRGGGRSEHFPGALSDADADLRRSLRVSGVDKANVERHQLACIAPSIHPSISSHLVTPPA